MNVEIATLLTVGMPTLAVLVGILINNSRLTDLRGAIDRRFDDMKSVLQSDLRRVEEVMDARFTRIEHELKLR